jgi:lipoic acid synthetase
MSRTEARRSSRNDPAHPEALAGTSVEVLIPDFMGDWDALATVMEAQPEILNHNTETVPRLYSRVRPRRATTARLSCCGGRRNSTGTVTKSGLMVGLGETKHEMLMVFADLADRGVEVLTVGQYLRPSKKHLPLVRYWSPEEFEELRADGLALGFRHVEAGPLVRSSYHAERQVSGARADVVPLREIS